MKIKNNFSYRLLFIPETNCSITYIAKNDLSYVIGGSVITCTAGPSKIPLKEAFANNHWINKSAIVANRKKSNNGYIKYPFHPTGSDERQFSSPRLRIPMISFHKSKHC